MNDYPERTGRRWTLVRLRQTDLQNWCWRFINNNSSGPTCSLVCSNSDSPSGWSRSPSGPCTLSLNLWHSRCLCCQTGRSRWGHETTETTKKDQLHPIMFVWELCETVSGHVGESSSQDERRIKELISQRHTRTLFSQRTQRRYMSWRSPRLVLSVLRMFFSSSWPLTFVFPLGT